MASSWLDGWMASPTQWTWVWVNYRNWWWIGKPGMLPYHHGPCDVRGVTKSLTWLSDWTEMNWTSLLITKYCHYWLNGHEFEQTPGDSEGQGSLVCCSLQGHKNQKRLIDWTTEYNHYATAIHGQYNGAVDKTAHHSLERQGRFAANVHCWWKLQAQPVCKTKTTWQSCSPHKPAILCLGTYTSEVTNTHLHIHSSPELEINRWLGELLHLY